MQRFDGLPFSTRQSLAKDRNLLTLQILAFLLPNMVRSSWNSSVVGHLCSVVYHGFDGQMRSSAGK